MDEQKHGNGSFWQSVPGILTGVTAAIGAVAGLVAALNKAGIIGSEPLSDEAPVEMVQQAEAAPPEGELQPSIDTMTLPNDGDVPMEPEAPVGDESLAMLELYEETYTVAEYGGDAGTQTSNQLHYNQEFTTAGHLVVEFTIDPPACSEIKLQILVDGRMLKDTEYFNDQIGPFDLGPIDAGSHNLRLIPTGRVGGCNEGYLQSWGGSLRLETTK